MPTLFEDRDPLFWPKSDKRSLERSTLPGARVVFKRLAYPVRTEDNACSDSLLVDFHVNCLISVPFNNYQ